MTAELAQAAFQRFVIALNRSRDPAALRAAVSDDVAIDRHGPGVRDTPGPVVQSFAGFDAVERWVHLTPPVVVFALAGAPDADGDHWKIEYALSAGEFHNGGIWRGRLAGDGRLASLQHQPFALPEQVLRGGAPAPLDAAKVDGEVHAEHHGAHGDHDHPH